MTYVLDASVVVSWYLPRQQTRRGQALLQTRGGVRWLAPHCLVYEVPNLLLREERKGVIRPTEANTLTSEILHRLGLRLTLPPDDRTLALGLDFARGRRLSLYDGLYLVTAIGFEAILASRDARLLEAANAVGCGVYDARDNEH